MRARLLTVPLAAGALAAVVAGLVVTLPGVPAAASHPCGPNDTPAQCAASGSANPSPSPADDVVLGEADSGRTVTLPLGSRLRVELTPQPGEVWADVDAGHALHRRRIEVRSDRTTASFTALSPTTGQPLTASTDMACFHQQPACASASRQWQVTVVVEDRQQSSPSPSPVACTPMAIPSAAPDTVLIEERHESQTIRVERGKRVQVLFPGCKQGGVDYQPAQGSGPLFREQVYGVNPGGAVSWFRAVSVGTTKVHAVLDAPCVHQTNGCSVIAKVWQVTVEVVEPQPCVLTGASATTAGGPVRLSGQVAPDAPVQVWFKAYGAAGYVVRRQLTAGPDGSFATSFAPVVDHRWYATSGSCTTPSGLTVVNPTVTGPATVSRGSSVPVVVRGFAGSPVTLYARRAGGDYRAVRTGRLDGSGTYRTSFVADVDHRYYAVTGPGRRVSAPALTQVR